MEGLADLHFHLLPGVDDGPNDVGDSLQLAATAVAEGTRTVVATPHVRLDFVTDVLGLAERVRRLRATLLDAGIVLRVRCGAELGHDIVPRLSRRELDVVAVGPPGARWVLLEAPFAGFGEDFHAAADELRRLGFGVLIAHPERSADAEIDGSAGLLRELRAGSLAQVNALSLTGEHGTAAEAAAFRLIGDGRVSVVASDAHGPSRPPALIRAHDRLLERGVASAAASALVHSGPRRLLARGIPSEALAA
jgi:protein-tyrosine phosphatase